MLQIELQIVGDWEVLWAFQFQVHDNLYEC